MDALATTHDRVGDDVLFLSVTSEPVGDTISEAELAEWWDETTATGRSASTRPRAHQPILGIAYPSAVAIDASGTVRWHDSGIKTADELVAGIERALEGGAE